ncbi:metalloregulator ArsR/SmtB family transcription factor [Anaerolineales bacterium]
MDTYQKHACGQINNDTEQGPEADLLSEDQAIDLAELFRAMGDANRMRIISILMHHELCVHDMAQLLNMSQSAVSHQMRALRQMHIVKSRKDGRHVFYTLDDNHVQQLFSIGLEHVNCG